MAPRGSSHPRDMTVTPPRQGRTSTATKPAIDAEHRKGPREITEEHHDACAKTICAGTFAERRQGRSPGELHTQQDEVQRQWELRQQRKRTRKSGRIKTKPRPR